MGVLAIVYSYSPAPASELPSYSKNSESELTRLILPLIRHLQALLAMKEVPQRVILGICLFPPRPLLSRYRIRGEAVQRRIAFG